MECRCTGGMLRRTIEGDAVPRRPTPTRPRAVAVALLLPAAPLGLVPLARPPPALRRPRPPPAALLGLVALAGPAAAAQDPTTPQATVTKGPSCDPGGMEIKVVAGTAPYAVRLATTREPGGEDEAQLQPGATVLLHTGLVNWGETVDPRLEYTALDASGTSFTDELPDWSMT